jgi:light-regulated signal transduction histidine kinase (bacteriophytochrome)
MGRRAVVVVGIGAVMTIAAVLVALSFGDSGEDPRSTVVLLVSVLGALMTVVAGLTVLLAERRAFDQAERMNQELREREHDLMQSNRELERFASVAAHDLQEPLRTVLTFTSLIERKHGASMDGEALNYLLRVSAAGQRMRALIESLLIYSRIGQVERVFDVVDLNVCVKAAMANVESLIIDTGAQITVGELPTVRGNADAFAQLFTNLLSNALKYRLGTPEVSITAQRREDEWVISVADNGKGIDPANHDRIFELFRRLEPTGPASGTGLGLAICARVVDLHGGRIWVRSTVGQGANFSFSIPLDAERPRRRELV